MGWPKKDLISQAYTELALAGHTFDLDDADVLESALRVMDSMMAEWFEFGIDVGYPLPATPDASNVGDDSSIPNSACTPVWTNLAVRLAGSHGKNVTPETRAMATNGYNRLLGAAVTPVSQASGLPLLGAGNKPWRYYS